MKIPPLLLAALLPAAALAQSSDQVSGRTWIADVTIISPEKLDRGETGSVLIENGRIARVERRKGAKKPAGATVVSGEGQFLIPGLIDSHVHLASVPGMKLSFDPAEAKPRMVPGLLETASAFLPLLRLYHARRLGGGRSPGVGGLQAGSATPGLI